MLVDDAPASVAAVVLAELTETITRLCMSLPLASATQALALYKAVYCLSRLVLAHKKQAAALFLSQPHSAVVFVRPVPLSCRHSQELLFVSAFGFCDFAFDEF
eukprot:m.347268 g.347268  ORF g.347268 m.347268 type:complete len:103 (+) comp19864_c0_seq14:1576-1884(+)